MKNMMLFLVLLFAIGSSTTASATSAESREEEQEAMGAENLPQIMAEVLRCDMDPMLVARRYIQFEKWYDENGDTFPPNYSDGTRDLMYTAYRILFLSHPKADWNEMVNYMWWTAQWEKEDSEFGPYATKFAQKEGVTPNHAQAFWSWRQELLRQSRAIMDDPATVRALYKKYKILLVTAAGWGARKDQALDRLDRILAIIRGTHELYPELMVTWSSESRDGAYNHNRYGSYEPYDSPDYWKSIDRRETTGWFYFLERRRSVGGDELMQAYEDILVDYMWTVAYNDFKFM